MKTSDEQLETEVLLNLKTGEVRRNRVEPEKRFRFHEAFTREDADAGWKQVATYSPDFSEEALSEDIEHTKAIYFCGDFRR